MNDDYPRVVLHNMPTDVRGFLVADVEGGHTVVLNARLSWEMNRKTYLHELRHIQGGDRYTDEDADDLEEKRHK